LFKTELHMVMMLGPDPVQGMEGGGARRNSVETQQLGHIPRSRPAINDGRSAKDGAPDRLRCETIQKEVS